MCQVYHRLLNELSPSDCTQQNQVYKITRMARVKDRTWNDLLLKTQNYLLVYIYTEKLQKKNHLIKSLIQRTWKTTELLNRWLSRLYDKSDRRVKYILGRNSVQISASKSILPRGDLYWFCCSLLSVFCLLL